MNLELVTNPTRAKKLIAKPTTLHWDITSDNLVSARKQKPKIIVDRPIYLYFRILQLSKITMYKFHYEEILRKYGSRAKLAYTNTDSFIYHIQTHGICKYIAENVDAYNTSDYQSTTPLLKDECQGPRQNEKRKAFPTVTALNIFTTKTTFARRKKPSRLSLSAALFVR